MSELHCFQHSKVYEQGRGSVWMPVSNPDPHNTIGLFTHDKSGLFVHSSEMEQETKYASGFHEPTR